MSGVTDTTKSSVTVGKRGGKIPATHGAIIITDEEGNAQPVMGEMQLIVGRLPHGETNHGGHDTVDEKDKNRADITETSRAITRDESNPKATGGQRVEVRPTTSPVDMQQTITTNCAAGGIPTITPSVRSKVISQDPADTDHNTSSEQEDHLERIWEDVTWIADCRWKRCRQEARRMDSEVEIRNPQKGISLRR